MFPLPYKIYLVSGRGEASWNHTLLAFDRALSAAGLGNYNHIQVSSVIPAGAIIVEEPPSYALGRLTPTVYSEHRTNGVPRTSFVSTAEVIISACLALAIPKNDGDNGMIFEVAGEFPKDIAIARASQMAKSAMTDRDYPIREILTKAVETEVPAGRSSCVVVAAVME